MSNALDEKERNSFENEFNFFLEVIDFVHLLEGYFSSHKIKRILNIRLQFN